MQGSWMTCIKCALIFTWSSQLMCPLLPAAVIDVHALTVHRGFVTSRGNTNTPLAHVSLFVRGLTFRSALCVASGSSRGALPTWDGVRGSAANYSPTHFTDPSLVCMSLSGVRHPAERNQQPTSPNPCRSLSIEARTQIRSVFFPLSLHRSAPTATPRSSHSSSQN